MHLRGGELQVLAPDLWVMLMATLLSKMILSRLMDESGLQAHHASRLVLVDCKTRTQSIKQYIRARKIYLGRGVKNAYLDDLIKCEVINIIAILFLKNHKVGKLADVVVLVHNFLDQIGLLVLGTFWVEVRLLSFEFEILGLCLYHLCLIVYVVKINLFLFF